MPGGCLDSVIACTISSSSLEIGGRVSPRFTRHEEQPPRDMDGKPGKEPPSQDEIGLTG